MFDLAQSPSMSRLHATHWTKINRIFSDAFASFSLYVSITENYVYGTYFAQLAMDTLCFGLNRVFIVQLAHTKFHLFTHTVHDRFDHDPDFIRLSLILFSVLFIVFAPKASLSFFAWNLSSSFGCGMSSNRPFCFARIVENVLETILSTSTTLCGCFQMGSHNLHVFILNSSFS